MVIPYKAYRRVSPRMQNPTTTHTKPKKKQMKSPKPKHSKVKDHRMHFRGDPDLDSLNRDLAETVQKVRETAPQVRSSRVYKEKGQLRLKFASVKGRNLADTLRSVNLIKSQTFVSMTLLIWFVVS